MKVTVTERDIEKAQVGPRTGMTCPIARAMTRLLSKETNAPIVNVGPMNVEINQHRYRLPEEARAFVGNFDTGFAVRPITFTLDTTVEV